MANVIVDAELFEKLTKNIFDNRVSIDDARRIAARIHPLASHCLAESLAYKRWTFSMGVVGAPIGVQPEQFFDEQLSRFKDTTNETPDRDFFNIWVSPAPEHDGSVCDKSKGITK